MYIQLGVPKKVKECHQFVVDILETVKESMPNDDITVDLLLKGLCRR